MAKNKKYRSEATWPMVVKGGSTGLVAVHVRIIKVVMRVQNAICAIGRKVIDRMRLVWVRGIVSRTQMASTRASVPPSLFGTERRIA